MVHLHSIFDDAESLRSSFVVGDGEQDSAFGITVDEPPGGPVVVRVAGDLDAGAADSLRAVLGEVLLCGRPTVLDLLEVDSLHPAAVAVVVGFGAGVHHGRAGAVIAAGPAISEVLDVAGLDRRVGCHGSFAHAFAAAHTGGGRASGGRGIA